MLCRFDMPAIVPTLGAEAKGRSDPPTEYPIYAPGYFAVFFNDAAGIHWELAHTPFLPTPAAILRSLRATEALRAEHPEWTWPPLKQMMRELPRRDRPTRRDHR